jgi:hypothetical protein
MRKLSTTLFLLALALAPASVFAGQVYTDGNGDGLPDGAPFTAAASAQVTVDIYMDSQSFAWTNYQAWIERLNVSYASHTYAAGNGTPFPIDNFSNPSATGFAGSGAPNRHGLVLIGSLTVHKDVDGLACLTPIIDTANPYGTLCIVATTSDYRIFQTAHGSCWDGQNATEETNWGAIKGLYQ